MMKTYLTPRKKREIYLAIAEKIDTYIECDNYVCNMLPNEARSEFTEFDLFEPIGEEIIFEGTAWFSESAGSITMSARVEGNTARIFALLLCAEMCK
jgi:hypothetical protein